ncbi:DUF421 domain-containing protein [Azohydromonas australica]|jgi:uncharacterized membrane protein YcaP (DUF421 family)|uniref:DUF421 domain-containing protein n=1 Tax=Azohydromonas australica TaxID=364039 RepID=UPI000410628B|nr:YetF domain-containing protein [Azohydromonas australica]
MFFDGWMPLARILVLGTLAYAALVLLLRVTGKRTLSKLNAFDLIVTVALGSTLATVLLSKDVALAEGLTALALLVLLQGALTWLSVRSPRVSRLVKSEPSLLFLEGRFLQGAMKRERVTEDELRSAVRQQGIGRLEEVAAVVLETDGSLNVIRAPVDGPRTALAHVQGAQAEARRHSVPRTDPS